MYDTASGVSYEIDIAQAEGSRIRHLTYDGKAVGDDQVFVVAKLTQDGAPVFQDHAAGGALRAS